KLLVGSSHFTCQPFAEGARRCGFLGPFGADNPIVAMVLHFKGKRAGEPTFNNRVGAQNLVTKGKTLPGFGGFNSQVILEHGALPISDTFNAVGVEPVGPPLLALLMKQIVVLEIFWLEV